MWTNSVNEIVSFTICLPRTNNIAIIRLTLKQSLLLSSDAFQCFMKCIFIPSFRNRIISSKFIVKQFTNRISSMRLKHFLSVLHLIWQFNFRYWHFTHSTIFILQTQNWFSVHCDTRKKAFMNTFISSTLQIAPTNLCNFPNVCFHRRWRRFGLLMKILHYYANDDGITDIS